MRPEGPRSPVAGPDSGPEAPFPIKLSGPVIKGFGRGSKELGIPTANIPSAGLSAYPDLSTGVYYGLVGLQLAASHRATPRIHEAVLSIGFNPFYKNTVRSIEIHILDSFATDFYGAPLNLLILGFIRPEYDYLSKESLIEDIKTDCEVAQKSLEREAYRRLSVEEEWKNWLMDFSWVHNGNVESRGDDHGAAHI